MFLIIFLQNLVFLFSFFHVSDFFPERGPGGFANIYKSFNFFVNFFKSCNFFLTGVSFFDFVFFMFLIFF